MHRNIYRMILGMVAALLLCVPALAQNTIPITGHAFDPSQGVPAGMSVKFELYNCGANYPRIVGAFGIVRQNFTIIPNAAGLLTGTVVPNDLINCGGVSGTTRYYITPMLNGIPQLPAACYAVLSTMGTFNLDTATPCTSATPPPPPGGPYDATYANLTLMGLLTGNNALFSGTVQAHEFLLDHTPTPCGSGYVTGLNPDFSVNCGTPSGATILSFNGRGGAVVPVSGDYTCGMVTGCQPTLTFSSRFSVSGSNVDLAATTTGSTCAYPTSVTYDAYGRITSITCGTAPGGTPTTCNANGCYRIDAAGTIEAWGKSTSPTGSGGSAATLSITFPHTFTTLQTLMVSPTGSPGGDGNPHPLDCHVDTQSTSGASVVMAIPTQISGAGYASPLLSSQYCSWYAIGS